MPPARNARKPRKSPTDKPPRPPNAWILYRTDRLKRLREDNDGPPRKQADISKLLGVLWAQEPDEVKRQYEKAAEIAKAKHAEKYPGYKYQPTSKEEK
ncbi:HMG-box, partial [Pilatotrama ljubarskyi]